MKAAILAIDFGTSSLKAIVYDEVGRRLSTAQRATPVSSPRPGWVEIDMSRAWDICVTAASEAIRRADLGSREIVGIGVTANGAGFWPLNEHGDPTRAAIVWNDGRAARQIGTWQREGVLDAVFDISGNVMMPGYSVPLLHWTRDHEPEVLERTRHLVHPKDWLRFRLTGDMATDESDASLGPFDIRSRSWAPEILRLCGLAEWASLLPPIRGATEAIGRVHPELAELIGLSAGCVVVTGLTDVAASILGAGAIRAGTACTVIGTTSINSVIRDSCDVAPAYVGQTFATIGHSWIRSLVNTTGTPNFDWVARLLFGTTDAPALRDLERLAQDAPPASRGLVFHPYLSSAGVIAPFVNPAARGNLFGISQYHDRSDVARAVYEGVARATQDCYLAMGEPLGSVILTGGGSRSEFLCQLLADTLGVPVDVPVDGELGARGAAMVAALGVGMAPDLETLVREWTGAPTRYLPSQRDAHDARRLTLYRDIARRLQGAWASQRGPNEED